MESKDIAATFKDILNTEGTDTERLAALEGALGDFDYKTYGTVAQWLGLEDTKSVKERVEDIESNPKLKYYTPQPAQTAAALTIGTTNGITFTAKTAGTVGNTTTIAIADPRPGEKSFALRVEGTDIIIDLGANSSDEITTTLADIVDAINNSENPAYDAATAALIEATLVGTGTTLGFAVEQSNLSGGLNDGSGAAKGAVTFDEDFIYVAIDDCDGSADMSNWMKAQLLPFYDGE